MFYFSPIGVKIGGFPAVEMKKLPLIVVMGKPCSGKSWISSKIAKKYKLKLISTRQPPYVEPIVPDDQAPVESSSAPDQEQPTQSQTVPIVDNKPIVMPMPEYPNFKNIFLSSFSVGLVIDGSTLTTSNVNEFIESCSTMMETHKFFVLNLDISDDDVIKRRLSLWVDPTTGTLYREEQLTSKQPILEETETQLTEDQDLDMSVDNIPFEFTDFEVVDLTEMERLMVLNGTYKDILAKETTDEMNDEQIEQKTRLETYMKNSDIFESMVLPPKWNILPSELRDKLRKRADDADREQIMKDLSEYQLLSDTINQFISNFNVRNVLKVDAVQSPVALLYGIAVWISTVVLSQSVNILPPTRCNQNIEGVNIEQAIAALLQPEDGLPLKTLSNAGLNCSMTLIETKEQVPGDPKFGLSYRGQVYLFSDEEKLKTFESKAYEYSKCIDLIECPPLAVQKDKVSEDYRFGATNDFCPVYLKKCILKKGDPAFAVLYHRKIYICSNEANMQLFMENPRDYVLYKEVIPPARFAVTGPPSSGKSEIISKFIPKDLKKISFRQILQENNPELVPSYDSFSSLPTEVVSRLLEVIFNHDESNGFVLEGFPNTESDAQIISEHAEYSFDFILNITCDSDSAIKRRGLNDDAEINLLENVYNAWNKSYDAMSKLFETTKMNNFVIVDGSKPLREVSKSISTTFIAKFIKNREALLIDSTQINVEKAKYYIDNGIVELSKFGYFCPVTLHKRNKPFMECLGKYPVLSGDHLFFIRDQPGVKSFIDNPMKYISKEYNLTNLESQKFCILSNSNEQEILERVSLDTNIPLLSNLQSVYEMFMQHVDYSIKSKYPVSFEQQLSQANIQELFNWVIKLVPYSIHGYIGGSWMVECNCQIPNKIFEVGSCKLEEQKKVITDNYLNVWTQIESRDLFQIKHQITKEIAKNIYALSDYSTAKVNNEACICSNVGLMNDEIKNNLSDFGLYCPVTFAELDDLVMSSDDNYLIHFKGKFFRTLGREEAEKFLFNPEKYASVKFPVEIPLRYNEELSESSNIMFKGYCPVSVASGALLNGRKEFMAKFRDGIYAFASDENLDKFLKAPWKFLSANLSSSVPDSLFKQTLGRLETNDYFDKCLSGLLSQAMFELSAQKPIFPYMSIKSSATLFMYLYLKGTHLLYTRILISAHNPNLDPKFRPIYSEKLKNFMEACGELKQLLSRETSNRNEWETFLKKTI